MSGVSSLVQWPKNSGFWVPHYITTLLTIGITDSNFVVDDWKKLESMDKISDCVIITTRDQMHRDPAIAFAKKGYHILLEKPMSVDEKECDDIANACEENNIILAVCHVLR